MPGPVRYDKKGRVKKTKPRSFGSASKPQPKSPAPVTAAASAVAKATKRAVSRADIPKAARKARKSILASKEAEESIERLRQKFSTNLDINQRTAKRERKLENTALKSLYDTRGEALKAEKSVRAATRLNAEGSRVESLDGLKQVGVQPLGQVQRAADAGQIRREGKTFTTPQVRQTQKKVKKAKRQLRRARAAAQRGGRINLPGGEGVFINELARQTKMDPRVLAAWTRSEGGNSYGDYNLLNIGHTGSGPNSAASNANFADPKEAAKATAAFLRGEWGGAGADIPYIVQRARGKDPATQIRVIEQSGWRLGTTGPDPFYSNLISGVYNDMPAASKPNPKARARLQQAKGRAASVARKAADLGLSVQGLVTPKQVKAMGLKLKRAPIKPTLWAQPKKAKGEGTVTWLNGTSPDGVNPDIIALGRTISRMTGQDIQITSALRPTDSDSNHSEGGALDINAVADGGAGERAGDAIAYSAVIAAGGTREQAEALASGEAGIVQFTSPNGHSMELLWKGDPGHRDHVHIAVETAARGKKVFRGRKAVGQGALSGPTDVFLGGGGSGSSGGVAPTGGSTPSAPAKKKRRQTDLLKLLRQLGYSVTSSGIKRAGGELSTFSEAPESITDLKKRYKVE